MDPQGTFDEIRDWSIDEHVDRALSDSFLTKKITTTIWELMVLSTGIGVLYYIGESNRSRQNNLPRRRRKREDFFSSKEALDYDDAKNSTWLTDHEEFIENGFTKLLSTLATLD